MYLLRPFQCAATLMLRSIHIVYYLYYLYNDFQWTVDLWVHPSPNSTDKIVIMLLSYLNLMFAMNLIKSTRIFFRMVATKTQQVQTTKTWSYQMWLLLFFSGVNPPDWGQLIIQRITSLLIRSCYYYHRFPFAMSMLSTSPQILHFKL